MSLHAFKPTQEEIGFDAIALARAAYERRKRMFAPIPKPKPKRDPIVEASPPAPEPAPVIVDARVWALIEQQRREAVEEYKLKLQQEAVVKAVQNAEEANKSVALKIEEVLRFVSQQYCVSIYDLKSHRRVASIVRPRQVFMYYCRLYTLQSLPMIGRHCGNRDHTTILYAVRKIAALVESGQFKPASENFIRASLGLPLVEELFESHRVITTGAAE